MAHTQSTPTASQAMVYQFWFDAAKAGKLKPKQDICAYRYRDDVKAMLIEPVNSQPVVIVGAYGAQGNADFSRFVLHTFGERSNSGTQFLRDSHQCHPLFRIAPTM